jgi:hypothetical protein
MRHLLIFFLLAFLSTSSASPIYALGENHEPGKIRENYNMEWPAGLIEIVNSADRVGGYWVNQNDYFFYKGDVKAISKFVAEYGKIPNTPVSVVLHTGAKALTGKLGEKHETPYNWELHISRRGWGTPRDPRNSEKEPGYVATVHVWLSDAITLKELELPKHVDVRSANEIEKFIEAHREHARDPR